MLTCKMWGNWSVLGAWKTNCNAKKQDLLVPTKFAT